MGKTPPKRGSRLADHTCMRHTLDVTEELPELLYLLNALAAGKETMGALCSLVEPHPAEASAS